GPFTDSQPVSCYLRPVRRRTLEPGWVKRFGERLGYRIDRFLAMHPAVQLASVLGAISATALLFATGMRMIQGDQSQGVGEELWWTVTRMVDGGTVAGDAGLFRRSVGMLITLVGLVAVAVLTGAFASGFAERLKAFRQGTLPIFERRHILVLGYNQHAG